jgi:hypothetical protein
MVWGRFTTRYAMDDFKDVLRDVGPLVLRLACLLVAVVVISAPLAWFQASQEAAAFNRFTTGSKATTWDALWVEFRVEADR